MNGSLFLFPSDPFQSCAPPHLLGVLQELALIGSLIRASVDARVFEAGDNFARHVVYAGCSPQLRFAPEHPGDRGFCHVALLGPYPQPRLVTGNNTVKPRCPQCRTRLADWQQRITSSEALICPACAIPLVAASLDWRQHAAAGRILLEMRNVFPGEASPSDQLLQALAQACDLPWRYAWAAQTPD